MKRKGVICVGIALVILLLFFCNLFYGSVSIPASAVMDILFGKEVERSVWTNIVLQSRLPQAITALLAGSALAVCGLMLQTLFRNPLADPSILGISNGANLGVAIVMLYAGGIWGFTGSLSYHLSVVISAFVGAALILMLILYFSTKVKSNVLVLIIGIMIGYLASSVISILNSYASADNIRSYVMWGMGNFSGVQTAQLPFYSISILIGLFFSILLIKPLNALLLGEKYAVNLGIHILKTRIYILLITGFLTAIVTAFCGPVTFIGLAVPHVSRMILGTSNQKYLLPAVLLLGAAVALLCNLMTIIPFGKGSLPLNAVTPVLGAPIIIYVILNQKNIQ
ncbi:iron ABC transporter [Bacteroidia bacterium]|nr:iron ABC transporter [Bacteroidia bacterium]GHT28794.1 iron ABC transporter [Bacteroidia bacterium]GHT83912.1 iron ABC transporter [Bacteroidia bacterium]